MTRLTRISTLVVTLLPAIIAAGCGSSHGGQAGSNTNPGKSPARPAAASPLDEVQQKLDTLQEAVRSGDGSLACSMMTDNGQNHTIANVDAETGQPLNTCEDV